MPRFFVPGARDREQAERVWQSTREFMRRQGFRTSDRRIYSIQYVHNGEDCFDKVGEKDRYGTETILVMLETDSVYLCCTANRGVRRGEPILTGKGDDTFVTDFDPDDGQDADTLVKAEEGA